MTQQARSQGRTIADEPSLIAAIRRGEKELFHDLILPYEGAAYRMAFCMLRDDADSEDVVQEAFIKAFRNLGAFRMESSFGTWLLSIVLNEARGRLRKKKQMQMESSDEQIPDKAHSVILADAKYLPSKQLEQKQLSSALSEAIANLPPKYRQVFVLRAVDELSISESAQILGITQAAVKVRLHRARYMLQQKLHAIYHPGQFHAASAANLESAARA